MAFSKDHPCFHRSDVSFSLPIDGTMAFRLDLAAETTGV
jgi:hypothetical protein